MKKELIVDLETAELEFENWAEAMDLDVETEFMSDEDKASFETQKRRLIRAITVGSLTFDDDSQAVYTPQNKNSKHDQPITFKERTGASMMAADNTKKGKDAAKMMAVMADITGLHSKNFAGLVGVDIKVCEAISCLLMG